MENKIKFKSFDGTNLVGICTLPEGQIKAAFLLVHGIPSNKDEWGFYKDMASFFYDNNIASLRFDLRYNGESQKGKFKNLTLSSLVNDIEAAYWQLKKTISNDIPVYIVGTSCGGGVSIKWLNTFNRYVKKVFLMAPVLDYVFEVTGKEKKYSLTEISSLEKEDLIRIKKTGLLNDDIGYGIGMLNEANTFEIKDEFSNYSNSIHIFHGDSDTIVPIKITIESIKGQNYIKLTKIKNADHGFAVEGDDDLTHPDTKANHFFIYNQIINEL